VMHWALGAVRSPGLCLRRGEPEAGPQQATNWWRINWTERSRAISIASNTPVRYSRAAVRPGPSPAALAFLHRSDPRGNWPPGFRLAPRLPLGSPRPCPADLALLPVSCVSSDWPTRRLRHGARAWAPAHGLERISAARTSFLAVMGSNLRWRSPVSFTHTGTGR